jgi:hypothetical protein
MPFGKIGSSLSKGFSDVKQNISDQFEEISTSFKNIGVTGDNEGPEYTGPLVFPHALRNLDRPIICMTAFKKEGEGVQQEHIFLPIPNELAFSDAAEYNEIALGALVGAGMGAAQQGVESTMGSVQAAAGQMSSLKGADVLEIIAGKTKFADQASLLTRTVANPNTNVGFKGHGIRSFTFNFTMMAKYAEEAETIRKIHNRFRRLSYANLKNDENNILLSYPPTWQIRFMAPQSSEENSNAALTANGTTLTEMKHIPRIFSSYLTGVTTTINDQGNMYHPDNAPLSVTLSITYQETRALNRKDLIDMENDQLQNRGINENGVPTITTPVPIPPDAKIVGSQAVENFTAGFDKIIGTANDLLQVRADEAAAATAEAVKPKVDGEATVEEAN